MRTRASANGRDYDRALALLDATPPGTVALVMAGHDHNGGYAQGGALVSQAGARARGGSAAAATTAAAVAPGQGVCHHVTFKSPLNRGADGACFGLVELFDDAVVVRGPRLADLVHARALEAGSRPAAVAAEGSQGGDEVLRLALPPLPPLP